MMETTEVERSLPFFGTTEARLRRLPPPHALMTLVLNADFQPLSTWPLHLIPASDAVSKIWMERVQVVETWKDALGEEILFRSPSVTIPAPKVVVLHEYVSVHGEPKCTRRNIYLRDRYCCQYCGHKFQSSHLTYDHVIPRSKGGKTVWTNILTCCTTCNGRKGDQMPEFSARKRSGLRPLKTPRQPTNAELTVIGLELQPDQIREDYGSWLYWSVELEP